MARSFNKVIIVGNVGRDPDMQRTGNGVAVAHFSVATNRRVGDEERTDWHRVTAWGRLAEFAGEHVRRGGRVFIEGELRYDAYERDGVTIPVCDVVARELLTLDGRMAEAVAGDD